MVTLVVIAAGAAFAVTSYRIGYEEGKAAGIDAAESAFRAVVDRMTHGTKAED